MQLEEFEELLLDWEEGSISEEDLEKLKTELANDPAAQRRFVQMQMLQAALKLDNEAGLGMSSAMDSSSDGRAAVVTSGSSKPEKGASTSKVRISRWALALAGMLIFILAGRLIKLEWSDSSTVALIPSPASDSERMPAEATSQGIALITRLVDVDWADQQQPPEVGDALVPGTLKFRRGFAQIEFFCGATVIVEGPAELELKSPLSAIVKQGRLRAQVPPAARGFSLSVDELEIVDLGTEFGLAVAEGEASIQVFDGEVELRGQSDETRSLNAGEGLTRTQAGDFATAKVSPDAFVGMESLESRAAGQQTRRWERWKDWSEEMRRDPRLVAYYAFDQRAAWQRRLNSSRIPNDRELDGAIVGAHRVDGRWPLKGGLEFKQPGDRVRVQIPGEFGSLTFACWVKIDSLDRWYNSLFLTDDYNQGEPHWQILDTGQLFFSVRYKPDVAEGEAARKKTHQPILSPAFWEPSMSGRWLHLATTYDANSGLTRHYLNGNLLHEETVGSNLRVETTRIGAATIGNWSSPTKPDEEFAIRNLNGSLDEFMIFADDLSSDEIRQMFEQGKP